MGVHLRERDGGFIRIGAWRYTPRGVHGTLDATEHHVKDWRNRIARGATYNVQRCCIRHVKQTRTQSTHTQRADSTDAADQNALFNNDKAGLSAIAGSNEIRIGSMKQ